MAALDARGAALEEAIKRVDFTRLDAIVQSHGRMLAILTRELFRIETDGVGVDVSDELRSLLVEHPVAANNLFETAPTKTSDESAAS